MVTRFRFGSVLAGAVMFFTGAAARAGFTYISVPAPVSGTAGGSTLALSPVSSVTTLSGSTFVNLANVSLTTTTVPPTTDVFSFAVTDPITITNVPPPGTAASGVITLVGTLSFTRSDTGGELSAFTLGAFTPSMTIGGTLYTLSNVTYSPPTVNNSPAGDGNISAIITATAVPEPAVASMLMAGMVAALARRRSAHT